MLSSKISALEAYKISIVFEEVSITRFLVKIRQWDLFVDLILLLDCQLTPYIPFPQSVKKLSFLDKLKANMGDEMSEQNSEEITKAMDL